MVYCIESPTEEPNGKSVGLFFSAHCCYERCLFAIVAYNGVKTKKNSLVLKIEKI